MTVATSLIPGLDEIVRHGDPRRRAEVAQRISELFLQGAAHFRPDHVELFDGFLIDLVPHVETAARADLMPGHDGVDGLLPMAVGISRRQ